VTATVSITGALTAGPLGSDEIEALRHKPVAEVAREFEAMLFAQMIGAMRKTVGESGLLSASPERRTMDGFFDLELARHLVKSVDFGLARQLTRQIEGRHAAAEAGEGAGGADGTTGGGRTGAAGSLAGSADADAPALQSPLLAPVSSGYGERSDPITGEPDFHAGIDLAAPRGTAVRAAAAGTVLFSGRAGASGNLVELAHRDGTRTSYAHLDELQVQAGEQVAAGQVLGAVGSTGRSTGPHLHFAVRRAGVAIDPAPLLGRVTG
jgi:murein DD-endopeptidase MepM/ murein hydrolase activator NlpD